MFTAGSTFSAKLRGRDHFDPFTFRRGFALPNPPDPRNPRFERQKEMPDVDLEIVIRHCRCAAAKTELCVTVVFFKALVSFDSKGLTAYPRMIN
jgi:hypothetical protein